MTVYRGWEIAKKLAEGKLENGTILKDSFDGKYEIKGRCLHSKNGEIGNSFLTTNDLYFEVVKNEYEFIDAFKAYENGETIQSCVDQKSRYRKIKGSDCFYSDVFEQWVNITNALFSLDEIRGKWHILEGKY